MEQSFVPDKMIIFTTCGFQVVETMQMFEIIQHNNNTKTIDEELELLLETEDGVY